MILNYEWFGLEETFKNILAISWQIAKCFLFSEIEMKFEMGFMDKKYLCCIVGKDLDYGVTK